MLKKFENFNKIKEDFRPGISAQAFWESKDELRKIIINNLLQDKTLTLDNYIKSNQSYINRLSIDDRKEFDEVIDNLNLPVWQKQRR